MRRSVDVPVVHLHITWSVVQCVAVCCSVLQSVAVCCSVMHLQCCSVLQRVADGDQLKSISIVWSDYCFPEMLHHYVSVRTRERAPTRACVMV